MKGRPKNASNSEYERALAYIHGRVEEKIITFADHFGYNPMELVARVGAVLVGAQDDRLPGAGLRPAPGQAGDAVAEVEVAERTHVGHAQSHRQRNSQAQVRANHKPAQKSQVKKPGIAAYWARMTPEERAKEMRRRIHKRSPGAKAKQTIKQIQNRNRLYKARAAARKQGLPPPPLPKEAA